MVSQSNLVLRDILCTCVCDNGLAIVDAVEERVLEDIKGWLRALFRFMLFSNNGSWVVQSICCGMNGKEPLS